MSRLGQILFFRLEHSRGMALVDTLQAYVTHDLGQPPDHDSLHVVTPQGFHGNR